MNYDVGVDEFGREHFVVEAPRGRLGISLGENEQGHVVIRGLDNLTITDMEAWEEDDRRRVQLMRKVVEVGDRIVGIQGDDVVHCSIKDIISRLGKLSAIKRRLTLARYHESGFKVTTNYDVEKLVFIRVPSGPLGLQINESIPYGAFVEGFQLLQDGSKTKVATHPQIHRGCQIINVNGVDVSKSSREEVIALLGSLKDQEKKVIFYRATPPNCSSIFSIDSSISERHLGFTVDEKESIRCVITSVGPRGDPRIGLGDVLIGVNMTDLTVLPHKDAIALVKETPLPRQLYFARCDEQELPECHAVQVESGSLGVNLDGERRDCARVTGFTSPQDAERAEFAACVRFVPGSFFISIGQLDVSRHDLSAISSLLGKLKQASKKIVFGNQALLEILRKEAQHARVTVPKGPLGINFHGHVQDAASVSGFYSTSADGASGAIEKSAQVAVGAVLQRINALNVSCLTLSQVTDLLKKLSEVSKELVFHKGGQHQDINTKVIDVRLPAGPLGIDLKRSITNKVIVDKLNDDLSRGSTRVFDHGGVVEGSEIVAIDGYDVSALELDGVLDILRCLSSHDKVITFSTTQAAYQRMLDPAQREGFVRVDVPGNLSMPLNVGLSDRAILTIDLQAIPSGSRIVGIENVDVRSLSLRQIEETLQSLQNATNISLIFDTNGASRPCSPVKESSVPTVRSPSLTQISQSDPVRVVSSPGDFYTSERSSSAISPSFSSIDIISDSAIVLPTQRSPSRLSIAASAATSPPRAFNDSPPSPRGSSSPAVSPPAPQPKLTPPPLLENSSSLARLSIRPLEATRSSIESSKLENDKQQSQPSQSTASANKTEFLINMSSWTGSRSLYRLVLDTSAQHLHISPAKATSPRSSKSGSVTIVQLNEIASLDCGTSSSQRSAIFRSSLVNADGSERASVVVTTTKGKSTEFDMRTVDERTAFAARMQNLLPSLFVG